MRTCKEWTLFALLCCCGAATLLAQRAERPLGEYTPQGRYKITGKALPKYDVVASFYSSAFGHYAGGEARYKRFLHELGIEPGTEQAEALTKATLLAKALAVDTLDMTPYADDPVAFDRVQLDWLRNQVHTLRSIYGTMLSDLRQAGYSVGRIEKYLEERVRPFVFVYGGGPDHPAQAIIWEFEEGTP